MIRVVSKKDSLKFQLENFEDFIVIDVTSHNKSDFWAKGLSPFYLGPVECYDGLIAQNVENAWQFSKVYPCHMNYSHLQLFHNLRGGSFHFYDYFNLCLEVSI